MHCTRFIHHNITWIGVNDRRLQRFENMFPLSNGVAYNSFFIDANSTCVMDSVDQSASTQYIENIEAVLKGRPLNYLVVQHMEPDHCGSIQQLLLLHPETKLVGNKKTFTFFEQFYSEQFRDRYYEVKENDRLDLGGATLRFLMTPNVHWPEVMMTYEEESKTLFSADAFGSFGVIEGNLFADEISFAEELPEMRRYYTNIVGRHGNSVQSAFKKLSTLELSCLCPLHGRLFRTTESIQVILEKYQIWSSYGHEEKGVLLVYASMYGNMESTIDRLAIKLSERGVQQLKIHDVSQSDASFIISDAFKYSHLVFGGVNYNTELYFGMDFLLRELAACNLQNRHFALLASKTWGGKAADIMSQLLSGCKNFEQLGETLVQTSSFKEAQEENLDQLADLLAQSVLG